MGGLRLPHSTIDRMDKARWGMLWKGVGRCSGRDCQVAWTTTCRLKTEDGLGIFDIDLQNICLLLKSVDKMIIGHANP